MPNTKTIKRLTKENWNKWSIAIKISPIILFIGVLKYIAHVFGLEMMELNALFSSLVAGTVFLIGFLISGVLSDYKESEKIPSDIATSLRTLMDDTNYIYKSKGSQKAYEYMDFQKAFSKSLIEWFYKKKNTEFLLNNINKMSDYLIELEQEGIQANFIIKMKNEQNNLRKTLLRVETIRDTDFIGSAYAIVEAMGVIIVFGLIIIKINPFYASLFMTLIISFLITYMFSLIKDLDNPFDYSSNGENGTEISLKPLHNWNKYLIEFEDKNN
jgi:hypothetical protein